MSMVFSDSLDGFTLFIGSADFGGTILKAKMSMPKRTLKERKPGGTNMPIKTQHGWSLENYEITVAGVSEKLLAVMNGRTIDQQQIMIRGAFTDEFTGDVKTLEIELWGRTEENDFFGEFEAEEDSEGSFEFVPISARCVYGDLEVFNYNARTGECVINETDETEAIRIALGRS